jgi:hypothetical protein
MNVTVSPAAFRFVAFDAELTRRIVEGLCATLGIDRDVRVEIDETTPLARMHADVGAVITLHVESGAMEDSKRPRGQSEVVTTANLGRILLRIRDRMQGGFAEAPADDQLGLRQMTAWETYSAGRLARLGVTISEQRWRYNFRNRHGFTDVADAAFDRIWRADGLTWDELDAVSAGAAAETGVSP